MRVSHLVALRIPMRLLKQEWGLPVLRLRTMRCPRCTFALHNITGAWGWFYPPCPGFTLVLRFGRFAVVTAGNGLQASGRV